jgi:hypothetical protein
MSSLLLASGFLWDSARKGFFQYVRGSLSGLKAEREEIVSLRGHLDEEKATSAAEEAPVPLPWKGGISRLKVVIFFPLLSREEMIKVMQQTSFFLKRGGEAEKEGF